MSNTKHVVILRTDLQMSEGLIASQAVHTAMEFIRVRLDNQCILSDPEDIQREWIKTPYIAILAVDCYEDLMTILNNAKAADLPCEVWEDTIPSPTFEGESVKATVGISIGPEDADAIKMVVGHLRLL